MARKKKAMDFSSLDLNLDALGDWGGDEEKAEKEFIRAAKLNLSPVTWDNAEAAADAVDYDKDYFALLSGRFIFGDFIEALVYKKELLPHRVYITTLGMSTVLSGVIYREITLKDFLRIMRETVRDSCTIAMLIAGATLFGYVAVRLQLPQKLLTIMTSIVSSKWVLLIILNVFLLIIGCFLETASAICV